MYRMHALPRRIMRDEFLALVRTKGGVGDGVVIVDGKPVPRGPLQMWILTSVQPMTGIQLNIVPEGDRETENLWLFSFDPIEIGDRLLRTSPVTGVSHVYQVQELMPWEGSYWQARITRVDTDANAIAEFEGMPPKPELPRRLV